MHSLSREASWTLTTVAISILDGEPSPRFRAVVRVMIPFLDSSFSKEVISSFLADTFSILADEQALVEALTLDTIELVTTGVSDNSPDLFRKKPFSSFCRSELPFIFIHHIYNKKSTVNSV